MIEDDDTTVSANIFMTPPSDEAGLSAEDSDDDDGIPTSINHLSGAQLSSEADALSDAIIVRASQKATIRLAEEASESSDEDVPLTRLISTSSTASKPSRSTTTEKKRIWKQTDLSADEGCDHPPHDQPRFLSSDWCPVDLFEFFDEDVISLFLRNTVKYAREQKGDHSFQLDEETLKLFLAILLLSGYAVLSRRRMYWEQQPDVLNEAVSRAMSRKKFEDILRNFHVADNKDLEKADKFAKVRPLLAALNERWLLFKPSDNHLSIDESMIPYYGKHGAKQHIHGKSIRFGYKMWSLATPISQHGGRPPFWICSNRK